ncbi:MAG: RNA polymerase subunit sigma [Chloroflexi bacterium]|nr:RNA polymerase subunit sigma [Chloroflexota bacterium]|tara:strand:+ start:4529 stop:5071 length:543 start_codon:yes stop_codon:yes gene_type:complete
MKNRKKESLYKEIYDKYHKDMYRYALNLSKSKPEAEDIVQESLLRAWSGIENLNDLSSSKSWLLTIVRREFLRKIEQAKRRKEDELSDSEYLLPSDFDLDNQAELNEVINLILLLEEEYKEILLLQSVYGYKVKEISDLLNINENTISTRVFRARKQLKELMSKKYLKERTGVKEINLYL